MCDIHLYLQSLSLLTLFSSILFYSTLTLTLTLTYLRCDIQSPSDGFDAHVRGIVNNILSTSILLTILLFQFFFNNLYVCTAHTEP